jgi:hypothetical protein
MAALGAFAAAVPGIAAIVGGERAAIAALPQAPRRARPYGSHFGGVPFDPATFEASYRGHWPSDSLLESFSGHYRPLRLRYDVEFSLEGEVADADVARIAGCDVAEPLAIRIVCPRSMTNAMLLSFEFRAVIQHLSFRENGFCASGFALQEPGGFNIQTEGRAA